MKKIIAKKITTYKLPYAFSIDVIKKESTTDFFMSNKFYRHKMHMWSSNNKDLENIMSADELIIQNTPEYMDYYIKEFGDEEDLDEYIEFVESSIGKSLDLKPKRKKKVIFILILSDDYTVEFEDNEEADDMIDFYLTHTDSSDKFHIDSEQRDNITSIKQYIQDNALQYIQIFLEEYNN